MTSGLYNCTKGAACTQTLTCKGMHWKEPWRGDAVSAYPPELVEDRTDHTPCPNPECCPPVEVTICTGPETCKDPSHE